MLGVSIEEIFDAARELQQSFDRAHDKGEMLEPYNSWTRDVWVEVEERPVRNIPKGS
jgi:hypothetical protein